MIENTVPHTNELRQILEDSNIKVMAASNKVESLPDLIMKHNPNLILLDVYFIKQEQLLIEQLMADHNIPIVVLSSRSVHDTAKTVYAITKGASDFVLCDQLNMTYYQKEVVNKINNVFTSKPLQKKFKRTRRKQVTKKVEHKSKKQFDKQVKQEQKKQNKRQLDRKEQLSFTHIVAIGTSTGGPKALQAVLNKFPKDFPAPIVIVQHMPSGFTKSLANRLHNICHINVKEAVDGDVLQAGTAYIAPGDYHMAVDESLRISIYKDRERDGHRPSVNILFESIAKLKNLKKIAVILTGMGKDGATGVAEIKQQDKEAIVIVESIETAIIHGMPRAAIETGNVTAIIRLENIAETIMDYITKRGN